MRIVEIGDALAGSRVKAITRSGLQLANRRVLLLEGDLP